MKKELDLSDFSCCSCFAQVRLHSAGRPRLLLWWLHFAIGWHWWLIRSENGSCVGREELRGRREPQREVGPAGWDSYGRGREWNLCEDETSLRGGRRGAWGSFVCRLEVCTLVLRVSSHTTIERMMSWTEDRSKGRSLVRVDAHWNFPRLKIIESEIIGTSKHIISFVMKTTAVSYHRNTVSKNK